MAFVTITHPTQKKFGFHAHMVHEMMKKQGPLVRENFVQIASLRNVILNYMILTFTLKLIA